MPFSQVVKASDFDSVNGGSNPPRAGSEMRATMIRFKRYLTDTEKDNYINPVTGENWWQEKERVRERRTYCIKGLWWEYLSTFIKTIFSLTPLAILIYLIVNAL